MTNSTKLIGLIMSVALWTGVAVGQGVPTSDWGDEMPPDISLPSSPQMGGGASMDATPMTMDSGMSSGLEELPTQQGDTYTPGGSADMGLDYTCPDGGGMWSEIAPIESTGTWLQRGFWYCEADAVILNRIGSRYDLRLAAQDPNVNLPPVNGQSLGFNPIFLDTNRLLILSGGLPGRDAAVRTTLGHFLFRDSKNRDHTVEFTGFGGGEWEQNRVMTSETPFGLFVPFIIDGGNISFDGSSRQTLAYSSNYKSFEANYHVKQRLGRDQLVMDPNGSWHRAAHGELEREYLTGLRYMQLSDRLDWQAEDIGAVNSDGRYLINTNNDLFGFQVGGGVSYQASRWSVGFLTKGGVYLNDALANSDLTFTDEDFDDSRLRLRENQLSFIGEFKLQSRFHLTPNVSVRGAYELMFVNNVAMAPSQATFIPEFAYLNTTGDPFMHGVSFGLEGYW